MTFRWVASVCVCVCVIVCVIAFNSVYCWYTTNSLILLSSDNGCIAHNEQELRIQNRTQMRKKNRTIGRQAYILFCFIVDVRARSAAVGTLFPIRYHMQYAYYIRKYKLFKFCKCFHKNRGWSSSSQCTRRGHHGCHMKKKILTQGNTVCQHFMPFWNCDRFGCYTKMSKNIFFKCFCKVKMFFTGHIPTYLIFC